MDISSVSTIFSSLTAPYFVKITFGVASDDNSLPFQWLVSPLHQSTHFSCKISANYIPQIMYFGKKVWMLYDILLNKNFKNYARA